ncbi:MAG TPA: hypothetical protein VEY67_07675 [Candidatus Dormibacteraeota bacterium]|nr:hypothetical protein [Candidatus Dormibacteraeota bacterium]
MTDVTRPASRLDDLDPGQLRTMATDARAAADAAPALRELLEPVAAAAEARLDERPATLRLPDRLTAEPQDVIVDQREAMARAVVYRDDASRPEPERQVWGAVVERLARARRTAKDAMAERRRADPTLETFDELIAAQEAAEQADDAFADVAVRDDPGETPGSDSGRNEPAAWQDGPAYPGDREQRAQPADAETTEPLVEGTGMAGGTGGAGSQNLPADTGLAPGSPSLPREDLGPPDIAHR